MKRLFGAFFLLVLAFSPAHAVADAAVQEEIRKRTEWMRAGDLVTVEEAPIVAIDFVPAFYENRQFRPAFTNLANIDALIAEIKASEDDGLRAVDFHLDIIQRLRNEMTGRTLTPVETAEFDILLTDTAARLRHQLFYGKVNPAALDPNWNIARPALPVDPIQSLEDALASESVPALFAGIRLNDTYYLALKSALRSHREIASAGGWPTLASGPSLKPGMSDPRIAALRLRLSVGGDYDWTGTGDPALYDPGLEKGVRD